MTPSIACAAMLLFPTGMLAAGVLMLMMAAVYVRVIAQIPCKKCLHRFVRISRNTAVQLDSGRRQRHLCAAANAAADQGIGLG